jgi:hypothetical protein
MDGILDPSIWEVRQHRRPGTPVPGALHRPNESRVIYARVTSTQSSWSAPEQDADLTNSW